MAWTTPRTWNNETVTAAKLQTEIGTNQIALKDPPSANYTANEGANYSTNSTTFADIDSDFSLSITSTGGDVLVVFIATANGNGSAELVIDLSVDGTRVVNSAGKGLAMSPATTTPTVISFTHLITGLSAGAHTIKPQFALKTGGGGASGTVYAGAGTANYDVHPQFWIREIS